MSESNIISFWESAEKREDADSKRVIDAVIFSHKQADMILRNLRDCDSNTVSNQQFWVLLQELKWITAKIDTCILQIEQQRKLD